MLGTIVKFVFSRDSMYSSKTLQMVLLQAYFFADEETASLKVTMALQW